MTHDKSGRNGTVRKYGKGKTWLCPITAAARMLYRAHLLNVPPQHPICVYRRTTGSSETRLLRDTDVTDAMREIAMATYTDPNHYLRVNVKRFSSHSNRITAAVALNQAKLDIDTIAHRLRWQRESVAHYLRETSQDIGEYTASAIIGSQRQFC
jgi:hypothetical protein